MSILSDIKTTLSSAGLPIATGVYTGNAKNYIVLTPLGERNDDVADDADLTETESADINLYYVGNYTSTKNQIKTLLKTAGFFIADSQYIETIKITDSEHQHHHVITVEKKTIL